MVKRNAIATKLTKRCTQTQKRAFDVAVKYKDKDEYKDNDKDKDAERITESLTVCYIFGILMTQAFQE